MTCWISAGATSVISEHIFVPILIIFTEIWHKSCWLKESSSWACRWGYCFYLTTFQYFLLNPGGKTEESFQFRFKKQFLGMSNFARYIHELFIMWMIIVSVKGTHHEHKHVRRKKDEERSILTRHQVPAGFNALCYFQPSWGSDQRQKTPVSLILRYIMEWNTDCWTYAAFL